MTKLGHTNRRHERALPGYETGSHGHGTIRVATRALGSKPGALTVRSTPRLAGTTPNTVSKAFHT